MDDETLAQQSQIISDLFFECYDVSGEKNYDSPANSLMRWFHHNKETIEKFGEENSVDPAEINRLWDELCIIFYADNQELCDGDLNSWLYSVAPFRTITYEALCELSDSELYEDWLGCEVGSWGDIRKVFPDFEA